MRLADQSPNFTASRRGLRAEWSRTVRSSPGNALPNHTTKSQLWKTDDRCGRRLKSPLPAALCKPSSAGLGIQAGVSGAQKLDPPQEQHRPGLKLDETFVCNRNVLQLRQRIQEGPAQALSHMQRHHTQLCGKRTAHTPRLKLMRLFCSIRDIISFKRLNG